MSSKDGTKTIDLNGHEIRQRHVLESEISGTTTWQEIRRIVSRVIQKRINQCFTYEALFDLSSFLKRGLAFERFFRAWMAKAETTYEICGYYLTDKSWNHQDNFMLGENTEPFLGIFELIVFSQIHLETRYACVIYDSGIVGYDFRTQARAMNSAEAG